MISSSENRVSYNGNGTATEFAYQFKILEKSDIKVMRVDADGNTEILTKDYYVDAEKNVVIYPGYAPGAEIPESERPPVLPSGWRLVLYREVPITQLSRLPEIWPFNVIEAMADKLTIICQQLKDAISRCLKINESSDKNIDTTIPWEAGKTFRVSNDGTHLESTEDPGKVYEASKGFAEAAATSATNAIAANKEAQQAKEEVKQIYNNGMLTPISDLAGSVGTELKRWGTIFANKVFASNLPLMYNSVSDMKADRKLKAGMTACTLGYYEPNDGGAGTYIIRAKQDGDVDDGGSLHEISSKLVAELVVEGDTIYPSQFGAKHNLTDNDSKAIQSCLNLLHLKKCSILDLQGFSYLINSCLKMDSMYKCTIKNGKIISNNFTIDNIDNTNNYILKTTDNYGTETPQEGSYGYAFEDIIFEDITIDCGLQEGVGCLYINTFFRVSILKCDFRRFKTYGINMSQLSNQDGHELIITNSFFRCAFYNEVNSTGIALHLTKYDCILSDLVIVGGAYGIWLEKASGNLFSNLHLYGCKCCIKSSEASYNTYQNIYFDGGIGLILDQAWYVTFSNCFFLDCYPPIQFMNSNKDIQMYVIGLTFQGCIAKNTGQEINSDLMKNISLIKYIAANYIDVACTKVNNNSSIINTDFIRQKANYIFFSNKTSFYYLGNDGLKIYPSKDITSKYTFEIYNNNTIEITNYNQDGYSWLGLPIKLPQNTDMVITSLFNKIAYKIIGFNSILNDEDSGDVLADLSQNALNKIAFNTGEYKYYFLALFNTGTDKFICNKTDSING